MKADETRVKPSPYPIISSTFGFLPVHKIMTMEDLTMDVTLEVLLGLISIFTTIYLILEYKNNK